MIRDYNMNMMAVISNVQLSFPAGIVTQAGVMATVSLVISLSIALLISDSRYWSQWASSTLAMCINPLLITFAVIVLLKIILIL